jgi:hypothetical protein
MAAGGQAYSVYVHSYLNFGLMMGRGAVLESAQSAPCLPAGVSGVYKCDARLCRCTGQSSCTAMCMHWVAADK